MTFNKQLPGLLALAATLTLTTMIPEGDVIMALPPLAIAGIGLGAKALGAGFGALRRRKRRKRAQAAARQALAQRLEGVEKSRRGAIQGQLSTRALQSEDQTRQLEALQQEALAASGGAQGGLNPAQLEAVIRANAMSNLRIDSGIADSLTRATQRAAMLEGELRGGTTEQLAAIRNESAAQTDAAIGGLFESAGSAFAGIFAPGAGSIAGAAGSLAPQIDYAAPTPGTGIGTGATLDIFN